MTKKISEAALSIDDDIAAAAQRLKALQDKRRLAMKKAVDKNRGAIAELLKREELDEVPIEVWNDALPKIKTALLGKGGGSATSGTPGSSQPAANNAESGAPVPEVA